MADFTWKPHRVEGGTPKWNVLKTDMEGKTTKTRLKSSRSYNSWTLFFRVQTQTEYEAILNHYNGQKGELTAFNWLSAYIPTHMNPNAASYFTVRYAAFKADPIAWGVWDIEIKFEEAL
jgi:hypothetical protein